MAKDQEQPGPDRTTNEKPISLAPLSLKEALHKIMQAPPEHEDEPKKGKQRKRKTK